MPRKLDQDYDRLKTRIIDQAKQDLARFKPSYVDTFQRLLLETGDLDVATARSKPLLRGGLRTWPNVLTAFFDLEVVRGKVAHCHEYLKQSRDSTDPTAGYWFAYHLDHWIFQTDAFLERCDTLFKKVIRAAIRPRDPDGWEQFQNGVAADLKILKDKFGEIRNPLAHSLGGGVAGIADQWEPLLAAPMDIFSDPKFAESSMESFFGVINVSRRRLWFRAAHRANLVLFAYSEAFSRKLLDKIDSLPPPAKNGRRPGR